MKQRIFTVAILSCLLLNSCGNNIASTNDRRICITKKAGYMELLVQMIHQLHLPSSHRPAYSSCYLPLIFPPLDTVLYIYGFLLLS